MEAFRPTHKACHIVHVGYGGADDRVHAVCPTLSRDILGEIEQAATKPAHLRAIAKRHQLAGLALIWNENPFPPPFATWRREYYPQTPDPVLVPFEPVELSEHDPRFGILGRPPETASVSGRVLPKLPPRRSYAWIFLASTVLGVLGLLAPVAGLFPFCAAVGLLPFIWLLARIPSPGRPPWYLIPGGVVVRHARFGFSRVRLEIHTPAESVLILQPRPPGWIAELRGSRRSERFVTHREFEALLRAWSSPLPRPTEFDDLL